MTIQERIKERRTSLGMTLAEVSYKVGISESTLSRYETNGIQNMGIDKLKKLADVLKTTPMYLMGWEEENESDTDVLIQNILIEARKATPGVKQQVLSYISFLNKENEQ